MRGQRTKLVEVSGDDAHTADEIVACLRHVGKKKAAGAASGFLATKGCMCNLRAVMCERAARFCGTAILPTFHKRQLLLPEYIVHPRKVARGDKVVLLVVEIHLCCGQLCTRSDASWRMMVR